MSNVELSINPHRLSGAVCIAGTRMWIKPAYKLVADPQWRKENDDDMFAYLEGQWPALTREAVLLACWWAARYGKKRYRKAWKPWLKSAEWDKPNGTLPPVIYQVGTNA